MTQLTDTNFNIKYSYLLTKLSKDNIETLEYWIHKNKNEYNQITDNKPLHNLTFWEIKNMLEQIIINRHFIPNCNCKNDVNVTELKGINTDCEICSTQFALEIDNILND